MCEEKLAKINNFKLSGYVLSIEVNPKNPDEAFIVGTLNGKPRNLTKELKDIAEQYVKAATEEKNVNVA